MKNLGLCLLLALFVLGAKAQNATVKFANVDASPMDALYYPLNVVKAKDNSTPVIKVIYSRPAKKGREVFGVLEQFNKVWRLGANENTEISFYKTVTIGNKKIKAGTYSLFAIPNKDKWTIIVNKQTDKWGAFSYDQAKDVVRVDVSVSKLDKPIENFSMTFTDLVGGTNLVMAWDATQVMLPILIK
ncbi:DUF2911 domain-containing protein [Pedobacter namyangjuensis]|uniref:DUF2911 domain-containing protein n=1 Tax=Pedobacter namyangjuensis TaxID=600626 RepID=UPI000DE24F7B|nr:DUF2911 domain-containing protein [Pedobacter namyangjuensis]